MSQENYYGYESVDGIGFMSIGTFSEKISTAEFDKKFRKNEFTLVKKAKLSSYDIEVLNEM